jgi:aspartyl/asparaginyl beta-hydroxylase (cupin superfamily)
MSLSIADFPALVWLTEQWETLRKEALALERSVLPLDREGASHFDVLAAMARIGRNGWTESWGINKKKWLTYGYLFMEVYAARYFNDHSHPETARLLSRLRGVKVCAVSLFLPDTYLPPHSHPELAQDGCLTYHLGLSVPEKYCYL